MFRRGDGDKVVCAIHSDEEAFVTWSTWRKGMKQILACRLCDKLLEQLKQTKVTDERHLK